MFRNLLFFLVLLGVSSFAQSADETAILIGQTSGLTGGSAGPVKESIAGARLYFDFINKNGGIYSRKIELITLDDGADPKQAAINAETLVRDKNVFILMMSRGTPHLEAILPILKKYQVPMFCPTTGAEQFHTPPNRLVFNTRTKYQDEAGSIIKTLPSLGIDKFGLVTVDDDFGDDVIAGVEKTLVRETKTKKIFSVRYSRKKADIDNAIQVATKHNLPAIIFAGSSKPTADFVRKIRQLNVTSQVFTLSNVSSESFINDLGEFAPGVIVSQVFPNPKKGKYQISREFKKFALDDKNIALSHSAMEGFICAKLIVEGLKRAGVKPSREKLINTIELIKGYDLGGFFIGFGTGNRTGSYFSELSVISTTKEFLE